MQREVAEHDQTGSEARVKRRNTTSNKTAKAKPSGASIAARRGHSSVADLEEQLKRQARELEEAREERAAIGDVLRVMSTSPGKVQPVLDAVAENAARLCEANNAVIFRLEGNHLRHAASYGGIPTTSHPREGNLANRDTVSGRAVCDRGRVHVRDLAVEDNEYPVGSKHAKRDGHRTTLATPLLREGAPVGAILIRRMEVRPFSNKQIALLETFAHQAAIAIENVRLFEAEQQRTRELQEALDYQTATNDVLRVISSSPIDLQPVLTAICETVAKLCETKDAEIFIRDGDRLRLGWVQGSMGTEAETWPITRGLVMGRAVLNRELIQVHDLRAASEEFPEGYQSSLLIGHRTIIAVPLMREGEAVGVLTLRRSEVKPYTDKQITLLRTFADQAVIAIENARLLNELRHHSAATVRCSASRCSERQTASGSWPSAETCLSHLRRSKSNLQRPSP